MKTFRFFTIAAAIVVALTLVACATTKPWNVQNQTSKKFGSADELVIYRPPIGAAENLVTEAKLLYNRGDYRGSFLSLSQAIDADRSLAENQEVKNLLGKLVARPSLARCAALSFV